MKLHIWERIADTKDSTKKLAVMARKDFRGFLKMIGKVAWRNKIKYAIALCIVIPFFYLPILKSVLACMILRDISKHKSNGK